MAVNINIKGSTHKSFKIGKKGVTIHQGNNVPIDAIDGDVWYDKTNYTPRMFNEDANIFQLPLMDAIGFKNNMLVSLASDISSDADGALEIDGFGRINVRIEDSINNMPLKTSEYDISSGDYSDDFVNNIVIKGKGDYGGLIVGNDSNVAMVKTADSVHLSIRAGNSTDELLPGNLHLSGGKSSLDNTLGNVFINGISYPLTDGQENHILMTDGNGNLFFQDPEIIKIDSIHDLDDVEIVEPTNGEVLTYEDGKWKNTNANANANDDNSAVGSEVNIDAGTFSFVKLDTSGDLSIYNVPDGAFRLTLLLTTNASTLNFSGLNIKWHQGSIPVFSLSENDDIVELITFDGGVTWYGSAKIDYK